MSVDIAATFTAKEMVRNGLAAIADDLDDDPLTRRIVIGVVECIRTKVDHLNGGARTPVVKFLHIEPMLTAGQIAAVRDIFETAYRARTGRGPDDPLDESEHKGKRASGRMEGEQPLPLEMVRDYDDDGGFDDQATAGADAGDDQAAEDDSGDEAIEQSGVSAELADEEDESADAHPVTGLFSNAGAA